jgi:hypothetical protein
MRVGRAVFSPDMSCRYTTSHDRFVCAFIAASPN